MGRMEEVLKNVDQTKTIRVDQMTDHYVQF